MEIESHLIAARTHGRCLVCPPTAAPRGVLVGFHGYMQDATQLLGDLGPTPASAGWVVAAVDALHAFYARGGSDRVVRSWMTRDLRATAITDNVEYVRSVLELLRGRFGSALPLVLLGYSQGAAMAWRAALLAGLPVAAVAALGGHFPPELAGLPADHPVPTRVLLGRGEGDEWYSAEQMAADRELLAARGVAVSVHLHPGGHEWTDGFRAAFGELLAASASGGAAGGSARRENPK